ncbi:MAG: hypothetical protein WC977_08880, partial [Anaerovoracaceae bacterium]
TFITAGDIPDETDPVVGAVNGIVKSDGLGNISAAIAETDYSSPSHNHNSDYDAIGSASSAVNTHETTYNHANIHAPNSDAETVTSIGALINGATAKTTPVDTDSIGLSDSAAGNILKKVTWANIKATLKSYFDAIYSTFSGSYGDLTNIPTTFTPSSHGNESHTSTFITSSGVTFENLNANGDVGTGSIQVSKGDHSHAGVYEPVISPKNTAFNKNFGTALGTVCQGNDSRLSDTRTPTDATVSYAKIANDLKSSAVISTSNIDWSTAGVFTKTLTGATTFTFSNLQLNKVITAVLTGDYTITFPSYVKVISGEYDGTVDNYIQFHCTNAGSGTEQVWCVISQAV